MGSDEIEEDKLRLFIRLLYGFPWEEYIPFATLLLGELDKSLGREAYPGVSEALTSDCIEEETKGFMMARRALVCSYLTRLQSFREKVTLQEKRWAKGLGIYKAMALSLFHEYLDMTTCLLFLSGDNLKNAVTGHPKWAKEIVLLVVQKLMTAFSDDTVSVPELGKPFFPFKQSWAM